MRFVKIFVIIPFFSGCFVMVPFIKPDQSVGIKNQESLQFAPGQSGDIYVKASQPSKVDRLIFKLDSPDAAKRTQAATDLGLLDNMSRLKAFPHLAYHLKNDRSKWVRRACAKSIGRINHPEASVVLQQATRDEDQWVAHSARNSLRANKSYIY